MVESLCGGPKNLAPALCRNSMFFNQRDVSVAPTLFLNFISCFEIGSYYVALAGL